MDGQLFRGRLDLDEQRLRLTGTGPAGALSVILIPYDEVRGIRIGRAEHDRINGLRSLIVKSEKSGPIQLASLGGESTIFDIGDLLAELRAQQATATTSVAVVVSLKAGRVEKARSLVEDGPPFDPTVRFERHHVFVGEREAIFVFEGEDVGRAVEGLAHVPSVWKAAAEWRECIEGSPRVAQERYAWHASDSGTKGRS